MASATISEIAGQSLISITSGVRRILTELGPVRHSARMARLRMAALLRIGWTVKRSTGSHRVLERPGWDDVVFAVHDSEEIGPRMLARMARHTGLQPDDL
jgi:predicted RNA binding protein YcfA (HicA-like mRNA interferase family)